MSADFAQASPLGEGDCAVEHGDCLSLIADATGHFWEKLWNLPANAALKEARGDPNVLLAGDRLTVPAIEPKSVVAATGMRHRFRRKGVPSQLRVRFLRGGQPRTQESFVVAFEGAAEVSGTLDGDGWLVVSIPKGARRGTIALATAARPLRFDLGTIDPIDTLRGIQARLNNLGYTCGAADGTDRSLLHTALAAFQRAHQLPEDGMPNAETRAKLKEVHKS